LSQKELQRVSVITACVKGDMACTSASPRSSAAPSANSASPSSPRNRRKPKAASNASGACSRIAGAANSASPVRNDLDSANRVLRRFIADYHRRLARAPRDTAKAWRPAPENIERICSFLHERIVSNDNVVQWEGHRFQIPPQNRRFSFAGAKVQLYQALDGRVSLYYGDTRLEHTNAPGG